MALYLDEDMRAVALDPFQRMKAARVVELPLFRVGVMDYKQGKPFDPEARWRKPHRDWGNTPEFDYEDEDGRVLALLVGLEPVYTEDGRATKLAITVFILASLSGDIMVKRNRR